MPFKEIVYTLYKAIMEPIVFMSLLALTETSALYLAKNGMKCIDCKKRWCGANQRFVLNAKFTKLLCNSCLQVRLHKKIH